MSNKTREQVLTEITGIGPEDVVWRDPDVWAQLERSPDSYDKQTGERVKEGKPFATPANARAVLEGDPAYAGKLAYNEFLGRACYEGKPVEDWLEARIAFRIELGYRFVMPHRLIASLMVDVARDRPYHPVRIYLQDLEWDRVDRLDTWLSEFLGVEQTPLNAAIGRRWAISAVARVLPPGTHGASVEGGPGCKVDTVLILAGGQGLGKSSALRILASPAWFSDSMIDTGNKDAYQNIKGKWLYEFAELDSMQRREATSIKAFLSAQVDTYRSSFGRNPADHPRQVLFVGTTNEQAFLNDSTGSRRMWPVDVTRVDLPGLRDARDQLWAEAVARYWGGERWFLNPEEDERRREQADKHSQSDPWEELVAFYIHGRSEVTVAEILDEAIKMDAEKRHNGHTRRLGGILSAQGWTKGRRKRIGGKLVRPWLAPVPSVPSA